MSKSEFLGTRKVVVDEKLLNKIRFRKKMSNGSKEILQKSNTFYKDSLLNSSQTKYQQSVYNMTKILFGD